MKSLLLAALSTASAIAAGAAPPDAPQLASSLVKLRNGTTLHYVVLHGAGDSWHSWELVLPRLPSKYRVFAVTLRGHGASDHPAAGYSRADFAGDIAELLEQLDLRNVTLAGHSLGSFVAQFVAETDDSKRLKRLVLIGSGSGAPRNSSTRQELGNAFESIKDPVGYNFARDFQASTAYGPIPPGFFETMVDEALKVKANTWHELGRGLALPDALERLRRIQVPTLVFWGNRDTLLTRADQDELIANIPNSRLVVYPNTGHALHWEQPERFARDLVEFMEH